MPEPKRSMNAEAFEVANKHVVVAKPTGFNLAFPNVLITIEGNSFGKTIADGIVRMLNQDQCPSCGKFNGLHGDVFHPYPSDGTGEVRGNYSPCPLAGR